VLYETGLDFTIEKVNLRTKETESGRDFSAINPKGYCRRWSWTAANCDRRPGHRSIRGRPGSRKEAGSAAGTARPRPRARMAQLHRHRTAQELQPIVQPGFHRRHPQRRQANIARRLPIAAAALDAHPT
jgi:glutathione S-transferase